MKPDMVVVQATLDMRAWVRRRREAHQEPTSDEVWNKIKKAHPAWSEEDQEYVFNYCEVRPKRRAVT